ncbi:TRAP transporter substrate-binding protein [Acuticoccus yangtzensis]|uniref:TRAP transporter substrate-binding protein n=1 Tax=Acuticoccus yangtzensis TaxID=1443441 RepID=UPI0009498724|nr:TRAP transporter substrate-binding protein [Acuticoccus yangtzensis]ORE93708.1 TRAP dicarboxylate transporter subunit DctP [Stappia sp. 22II-S9-Z10]
MKLSGTFAFAAALGAAALTVAVPASAETTWLMASGYPEENFHTKNIRMFIDEVAEASGGELTIDLQPNDSLIKLDSIKRAVQSGQIPIGEIRLGVYGNEDPMYILAGVPFIASTYEAAWELKDAQKPYFDKIFDEAGMKVLFYSPWPGQGFYTKFPVESPADFEGVKIRIYSTSTQEMAERLGFQATILPFAEVPQAFSTGLIEALFTSPQTGIDVQAWDNTSNYMDVGALYSKNAVIVSKAAFEALPAEVQEAVLAAAETAEKRGWEMSEAVHEEQKGILAENGMTVTDAPESIVTKMTEVGGEMLKAWKETASEDALAAVTPYFQAKGLE